MSGYRGPIQGLIHGLYDGPHATPPDSDSGPIFLGIKNVTPEGRLDFSVTRHVSETHYPKWTRRVTPEPGDIVFSYEATLHRYALIPEGFRGCLGRRMALIRLNRRHVNPRFLHYYFHSRAWRRIVEAQIVSGATVDRIPPLRFPEFEVSIPSLDEQCRIASILSAYDDLIENNRRRIQLLEQAARLLYREWFVHLRFPGHEHITISDGVPSGWIRTTIGEFSEDGAIDLQTGPFGTQLKASDYTEDGTPVINVRNIGYGTIRPEKIEFLPEQKVMSLSKHILQIGDIVFGRKGAVDRHVLIGPTEEGWMQGSDCIRMRIASRRITPSFVSLAFREDTHKSWMLSQCGNKATMASLSQDVIARIPLLVPSHEVLLLFDDYASRYLSQIALLQRQSDASATARDLLLPRLMKGEVAL